MEFKPLADRLRPQTLEEVVGQKQLTSEEGFIAQSIQHKKPLSILLWGPPGSGKTSIARLYASAFDLKFIALSAVWDGIGELKKLIKELTDTPLFGKSALLFVDEIHRFNRAQQDAFLPFLENGTIILIGATAENPSFYLNPALLSRLRTLCLKPLDHEALQKLMVRYEERCRKLPLTEEAKLLILEYAQGDGRYLFNLIENLESFQGQNLLTPQELNHYLQRRSPSYDRNKEQHYNLISALHKSVRGSDPDAALYWFMRMLEGGEDPLFLARRLIRMATEDIGLADPQALPLAIAARDAYQALGSPEGELALAEALIYLALAPKSNALYTAYGHAKTIAAKTGHFNPPKTILNAPTQLMKQEGYGKGYQYDHDLKEGFSGQSYFPEEMERTSFYNPVARGFEREMQKRLEYFKALREKLS